MKLRIKRQKVMTIANALVKEGYPLGEAQKMAWGVVRCIAAMETDEISIRYYLEKEVEFDIAEFPQQRVATMSQELHKQSFTFNAINNSNPLQVRYFDQSKHGWRSFKVQNFVSFATA